VFGALRRNVPHWVPTAKLATLAVPKQPPTSSTSSVTTTLTDATIASEIPPPAPATTVSIASVSTSIPDPSHDDPFLIDRTRSPVQEDIEEHRRQIGALLQQINALEEEYEQYPETESDEDEEMERQDYIYFTMNERERVSLRRRIALLKQQIKDATALFKVKPAP
jgi:TolA-binding protein